MLGITPDRSFLKGDVVSKRSKKPTYREQHLWLKKSALPEEEELSEHILMIAELLRGCHDRFLQLEDCGADLICGLFSDNTQLNTYIEDKAIQAIAPYNLDLLISGYTADD